MRSATQSAGANRDQGTSGRGSARGAGSKHLGALAIAVAVPRSAHGKPPAGLAIAPPPSDLEALVPFLGWGADYFSASGKPPPVVLGREVETLIEVLDWHRDFEAGNLDVEVTDASEYPHPITGVDERVGAPRVAFSQLLHVWLTPDPERPGHLLGWRLAGLATHIVDVGQHRILVRPDYEPRFISGPHGFEHGDDAMWHTHGCGGSVEGAHQCPSHSRPSSAHVLALHAVREVCRKHGYHRQIDASGGAK